MVIQNKGVNVIDKKLYREELSEEDLVALKKYLANRLSNSACFNTQTGYWYDQSPYTVHFVLNASSLALREEMLKAGFAEIKEEYSDILNHFNVNFLIDDFNADFVFEIKIDTDLTYIYGLARIVNT